MPMPMPPAAEMFQRVLGFVECKVLMTVAELGVPDLVAGGARHVDDLAAATGTDPTTLLRLLRASASSGVLEEVEAERFANTPLSDVLRSDAPGSVRPWAVMFSRQAYAPMGALVDACRTGQPTFASVHGAPVWDFLAAHPDENDRFNAAMATGAALRTRRLVERDWSGVTSVVDVGGNTGELLAAILAAHPHLSGVVFDQPHVVDGAAPVLAAAGVADRCQIVGGSFFDDVPKGADVYLLAAILHDWDDEHAASILRNVRAAVPDHGRVLVVDFVLPPSSTPSFARLMDMVMLTFAGGRERDADDWRTLLTSTGFRAGEVVPGPQVSIIEATPAG
jgi:hypothetical protein